MKFIWPLENIVITQKFGNKSKGYEIGYHMGVDLRAKKGTPIFAAQSGEVVISKALPPYDGYGAHIVISHGQGFYSMYAHLDKIVATKGQKVHQGDLIGFTGGNPRDYGAPAGSSKVNKAYTKAGFSTAAHLHFEIDKGGIGPKFGIDPQPLISLIKEKPMQTDPTQDPKFYPDWAKNAIDEIRALGIKLETPNAQLKGYELAEILRKLGLLKSSPEQK